MGNEYDVAMQKVLQQKPVVEAAKTTSADSTAQSINLFAAKDDASINCDTCQISFDSASEAAKTADDTLNSALSSLGRAEDNFNNAQEALENAKQTGNQTVIANAEKRFTQAQQAVEKEQQNVETAKNDQAVTAQAKADAEAKLEDSKQKLETATSDATKAQEKANADKATFDTETTKLSEFEAEAEKIKQQETEEAEKNETTDKVKQSGKETHVSKADNGYTQTVTENSKEFKEQEKENIETAKEIKSQYLAKNNAGNALSIENSLVENEDSARTIQRQELAKVEYTPAITETVGKAENYIDEADSANNNFNGSTSTVRDKSEAVQHYLTTNDVEPTGYDSQGNPHYSAADIYAAEYAVSALQPDIVNNAKEAEAYRAKFTEGTATAEEKEEAIKYLKEGREFNDTLATNEDGTVSVTHEEGIPDKTVRTVSDSLSGMTGRSILNETEKNALIDKINSGSTDFSERELNALTYLQGTTDIQGFPTVPAEMEWELPASFSKFEKDASTSIGETYVVNISNGYGNNTKFTVTPDSDMYKIFAADEVMAEKHSETFNTKEDSTERAEYSEVSSSNSNKLYELAYTKHDDSRGTVTAQELLDNHLITQETFDSLENKDTKYEIPEGITKDGMKASYSEQYLTDGDVSTKYAKGENAYSAINNYKQDQVKSNGGYFITNDEEAGWAQRSNSSLNYDSNGVYTGKSGETYVYHYEYKNGKVSLVQEKFSNSNPLTDSQLEQYKKEYEELVKKGLIK